MKKKRTGKAPMKKNQKKTRVIDETIGWYGTAAIVISYALVSFGTLASNTWTYLLLNCTGAIGIAYISFKKKTYQPGVLNVIWAAIAVIAMIGLLV